MSCSLKTLFFHLKSLDILSLELRMLGLMKTMVENPVLNKEIVLKQIGDAENIATFKMKKLMEKRGRSSIEEEEPIQSKDQIQNKVNQNISNNFLPNNV